MKHHHAPEFLLSRWCREDGRICIVRNFDGRIARTWRPPSETGFEHDLYTYSESISESARFDVETRFMSPLDNEAAPIVRKMAADLDTDPEDRLPWARFIAAMKIRTPQGVALLESIVAKHIDRAIQEDGSVEWTNMLRRPGLARDLSLEHIPQLASSDQIVNDLLAMASRLHRGVREGETEGADATRIRPRTVAR